MILLILNCDIFLYRKNKKWYTRSSTPDRPPRGRVPVTPAKKAIVSHAVEANHNGYNTIMESKWITSRLKTKITNKL